MKRLVQFIVAGWVFGGLVFSTHATFSSLYIFGDSISATATNNASGSAVGLYYGRRYSNGRTWVEVLAQRQGLGASSISSTNWNYSSNNLSFYGHYSSILVTNAANFIAPANATNCLFVVWVNNADFVGDMFDKNVGDPANAPSNGTNLAAWNTAINQHLTNHFNIITNLYAKGCRALVAPNAADVTAVPQFNSTRSTNYLKFVRQRIASFNTNYVALLNQISEKSPGLTIYCPDINNLLNNVLTNAASYGLTNALLSGQPIDALDAVPGVAINGPGTNYIFWDFLGNPTAKLHAVVADIVQQMISPVQFAGLAQANGSNRLDIVNLPVGLTNGFVLFATNLTQAVWPTNQPGFSALTTTQSVFVPLAGAQQFYRLKFPWQWSWP